MPNFSKFNGTNFNKKLTSDELLRALRFAISAEIEAIQVYDQLAKASDNKLFKKVMLGVAEEEKVHIGEFMKVLFILDYNERKKYREGFKEVEKKDNK